MIDIKTRACTVIYKSNAFLYYVFNNALNAFFVYSVAADGSNNIKSKKALAEVYEYFLKEIVKNNTAYCRFFKDNWLNQFMEDETIIYDGVVLYKCKHWNKVIVDSKVLQYRGKQDNTQQYKV